MNCGCSKGVNFTAYQEFKKLAHRYQPESKELPSYQHMVIGLISGAMGPFSNAPIDTIKTREIHVHTDLQSRSHQEHAYQDCRKQPTNPARRHFRRWRPSPRTCGDKRAFVHSTRELHLVSFVSHRARPSFLPYMRE